MNGDMDRNVLLAGALSFLAGVLLLAWKEHREAINLRLVIEFLRGEEEDEHVPDPSQFGSIIERIRMVLSATKLARLLSWLLLLPSSIMLTREINRMLEAAGTFPSWINIAIDFASAVALFAICLGLYGIFQVRASRAAAQEEFKPPEWMLNRERHVPGTYYAGWLTWEHLMDGIDLILARAGFGRPHAQLYEQDRWVRLRILAKPPAQEVEEESTAPRGTIERTEEQMIRAIQRLDQTVVREVMRPINQVTAIRLRDYTPRRLLELCRRTGFTRIPVYEDQITNLKGYINIYDILDENELPESLEPLVTEALFVPEVARVDMILQQMIRARQQVAIVFDEFGGTSGWLSREDIIEEIVGEVEDEYERPFRLISESAGGYLVDASVDLDDLREETGLELSKRYSDTVAGYVYYRLGRVPKRGETIEEKGWKIRVAAIDNHRIRRLRLIPPAPTNDN